MSDDADPWSERTGAALRASERPDAVVAARLAAARARAVDAARRPASRLFSAWPLPAGAAAAALLAFLVLRPEPLPPPVAAAPAELDALELLTDENDPQFYRDLELYVWLEGQDGNGQALLLAAAVAATVPPAAAPAAAREEPPPLELLEFIGDWSEDEARQFLDREPAPRRVSRDAPEQKNEKEDADVAR